MVAKAKSKLKTKLFHVDIHNHWLRQEVSAVKIAVEYVLSAEMIADGFSKVLPVNKWDNFLQQLRLVDVKNHEVTDKAPLEVI